MDERRARKHELLQEFNTLVAPQKLKLEQLLPGLWRQCYDGAGSAPAPVPTPDHDADKSGAKRDAVKREQPLEDVPPPEPKRAKSADPQARKDELFKECGLIVKRMCGVKSSKWFRKPVDDAQAPNYFALVTKPMDLATAREKLSKKLYASPMEFKADMDQIWINCFVYNQPRSEPYEDGLKCQKKWEDTWAEFNIEDKWLQLQLDVGTSVSQPTCMACTHVPTRACMHASYTFAMLYLVVRFELRATIFVHMMHSHSSRICLLLA
eukprot:366239-Chlamydomonas_euryale.AAC.24